MVKQIKRSPRAVYHFEEICKIIPVDVLAKPISTDHKNIIKESIELAKISNQIVAKIPISHEGLLAVKGLKQKKYQNGLHADFFHFTGALVGCSRG